MGAAEQRIVFIPVDGFKPEVLITNFSDLLSPFEKRAHARRDGSIRPGRNERLGKAPCALEIPKVHKRLDPKERGFIAESPLREPPLMLTKSGK